MGVMNTQPVIEGWRGVLVDMKLHTPIARAATAAVLAGAASYAVKYPKAAYRRDGSLRPARTLSLSADATDTHFLLIPLGVAALTFLFT